MTDPEPRGRQGFSQADVQRMIDESQAKTREQHQQEMRELRSAHDEEMSSLRLALSGVTASPVAWHAGGPEGNIAPTWSAYDQMLATNGEHPWQQGNHADWLAHPDHVKTVRGISQPE